MRTILVAILLMSPVASALAEVDAQEHWRGEAHMTLPSGRVLPCGEVDFKVDPSTGKDRAWQALLWALGTPNCGLESALYGASNLERTENGEMDDGILFLGDKVGSLSTTGAEILRYSPDYKEWLQLEIVAPNQIRFKELLTWQRSLNTYQLEVIFQRED